MKNTLWTLALLVTLTSCVTYRLQPVVPQGTKWGPAASETLAEVTHDGVTVEATAEWGSDVEFDVVVINRTDRTLVLGDRFQLYSGDTERWREGAVLTFAPSWARWSRHSVVVWARRSPFGTTTIVAPRRSGGSVTIVRTYPYPWFPGIWWSYEDAQDEPLTVAPGATYQFSVRGDQGRGRYYRLVLPIEGKDYEVFFERIRERSSPFTNL